MELIKKDAQVKVLVWEGVTFKVRAQATSEDRFEIKMLFGVDQGDVKVPRREIYLKAIERFTISWSGVQEDGKDVPFSMENLKRLPVPAQGYGDVILDLGAFIINTTGLFGSAAEGDEKNA